MNSNKNIFNFQNKKLIYIHNSFNQIKKIPKKLSQKINPKNFLEKDEYLIDYDMDSEEEYLEQNAEDINSNDNDDKEEDEYDYMSINQRDEDFIVPDGHLSKDELSETSIELMQQKKLFKSNKLIDIKTLLNIRKNYAKPILINFTKNDYEKSEQVLILIKKLTVKLFDYDIKNDMENDNNLYLCENKFPIIVNKNKNKFYIGKQKEKEVQNPINNHFVDIMKIIHGSYDTKENLISEIVKKYNEISKNILNNFFKEKCAKIQKKYWTINSDILKQFNIWYFSK